MLQDIAFLILGAILGAVLGVVFPAFIERLRESYVKRKKLERKDALNNTTLTVWLQAYHEYHHKKYGIPNELPFCEIDGYRERVPFLSKKEWDTPDELGDLHKIDFHRDAVLQLAKSARDDFEVDEKLINRRKRFGHEIWNADTLYLEHIDYQGELPVFQVKTCKYYASTTNMIALEEETIRAVRRKSFENCRMRKQYYLTTNGIENNILTPITIGCLVVFALRPDSDYEIILQTRSEKNVTANAVTSVAPICGLSPFVGDSPGNRGLLYYNFVREYLEELHCIRETRELERQDLTRRSPEAYDEWLYDIEPAKKLIGCEYFDLYYIGFGFNLANGNPNIGLLAKLDDSAMSQEIKRSIFFNWEVDAVDFVGAKSGKLGRLFSTRQIDPASSFFISRALKYLT